jgi:hypothetical protein
MRRTASDQAARIRDLEAKNARLVAELVLTRSFVPADQIPELEQLCQLEMSFATQGA